MTSKNCCWSSNSNSSTNFSIVTYYKSTNISRCISGDTCYNIAFFSACFIINIESNRQLERSFFRCLSRQRQLQCITIRIIVHFHIFITIQNGSSFYRLSIPFKTTRQFQFNCVSFQSTSRLFFNFQSCSETFLARYSISSRQGNLAGRYYISNCYFTTSDTAIAVCINSDFDRTSAWSCNIHVQEIQVDSKIIISIIKINLYSNSTIIQWRYSHWIFNISRVIFQTIVIHFNKYTHTICCTVISSRCYTTIVLLCRTIIVSRYTNNAGIIFKLISSNCRTVKLNTFRQSYSKRRTISHSSFTNVHFHSTQLCVFFCGRIKRWSINCLVARSCMDCSWCSQCCDWSCYTSNQCCCCQHVDHFFIKLCHNLFFSSLNITRNIIFVFLSDLVTHQSLHLLSELYENPYKMISVTISQKLGI
ncbi:hypothetical protein D1872_189450 [compost metagenome]